MEEFKLTPGSTYRVTSVKTRKETTETEGTFEGITSMGSVDALVIDVDGRTRLLPTHMVLSVDVLEAVGEEEMDEEDNVHYM